jgi:hypothetical protein
MTRFEDQLLADLIQQYGPVLQRTRRPARASRRTLRRPAWLAAGAAGAAAVAVGPALMVAALMPGSGSRTGRYRLGSADRLDGHPGGRRQHLRDHPRAERSGRAAKHAARRRRAGQRHVHQPAEPGVPAVPRRHAWSAAPEHTAAAPGFPRAIPWPPRTECTGREHEKHCCARPIKPAGPLPGHRSHSDRPFDHPGQRRHRDRHGL